MPGPSGKVSWPPYLMIEHGLILNDSIVSDTGTILTPGTETLNTNAFALMNTAFADGNPYANAAAFDPDTDLGNLDGTLRDYITIADDLDPEGDWETYLDLVLTRIDEIIPADDDTDEDVAAFTAQQLIPLAQAYNRININAQESNATMGTSYPTALALVETKHLDDVSSYSTSRRNELSSQRTQALLGSVDQITKILNLRIQANSAAVQHESSKATLTIQAKNAQVNTDVEYISRDILWDFQIMKEGWTALSGIQGVPGFPEGLTPEQQAFSALGNAANFALPLITLFI